MKKQLLFIMCLVCSLGMTCSAWCAGGANELLYQELALQLQEGKPIVITSYIGLWYDHQNEPERNLYWGNMGGHYFLFKNSPSIQNLASRYRNNAGLRRIAGNISRAVTGNLTNYKWVQVYYHKKDTDPKRIAVFKMTVEPNGFWRSKGVEKPFAIYNVMFAYSDMKKCMKDMVHHLKQDRVSAIGLSQRNLDLGQQSCIMGYIGHNIYYGGICSIDELESVSFTSKKEKGLFFLGCMSARWCPEKFISPHVSNLLFCETNMAPEGYIMLGLLDGLSRGLSLDELVGLCNRVYGVSQRQGENIRLFVNGEFK